MSQVTNYTVENAGGATVRADINNILLAIQSNNSGVSAPSTTYPGMLWLETPASGDYTLKVRDKGNNHWLTVGVVTDPGSDDEMGTRLLQGAASKTHIKRSDGTVLLAEDGSNVATLTNVVLGTGSSPASTPLLAMAASSTGITRSSGTALLTEDGSNVATLDQLTLGPGSGATNLKMGAVKLTADGRLERSDGTDILIESSNVATLDNVTLGSSVVLPAGAVLDIEYIEDADTTDRSTTSNAALGVSIGWGFTITHAGASKIHITVYLPYQTGISSGGDTGFSIHLISHTSGSVPAAGTVVTTVTGYAEVAMSRNGGGYNYLGPHPMLYSYAPGGADKDFFVSISNLHSGPTATVAKTNAVDRPRALVIKEA